jgi:hypothetical protein
MLRRKRVVRLHLVDSHASFEGVLLGVDANHYRLANVKQLESSERTIELAGDAWVPRSRVLYVQVVG